MCRLSFADEREALILEIERKAEEFRRNGDCERWLQQACPIIKEAAAAVNGPLLEYLAHLIGHGDLDCVDLFRYGTPWQASAPQQHVFLFVAGASIYSDELAQLWWKCRDSNDELLRSLHEDETSAELHRLTLEDADKGRMSKPCDASEMDLDRVLLVPRFGVVRGTRANGEPKVRPVDHFSWSARGCGKKRTRAATKADSVNGHFDMPNTVSHDHLDDLMEAMRVFHERSGRVGLLVLSAVAFTSFVP